MPAEDAMTKQNIEKWCGLEGQPLSGRPLKAIVESYKDGSHLVESIRQPEADQDFSTKFIRDNEAYVQFDGVEHCFLRVCHNLKELNACDEVFLFIHGLGGTLEQFEPLLRALDDIDKKFLALDLPGFGKSDQWDSYDMIDVVEGIHQVVNKVAKSRNCQKLSVVGHSMGCYLSIHYFLKYHELESLNRLILLAPPKSNVDQLAKDNYWFQVGLHAGRKFPWLFDIYRERFDQCKGLSSSGIRQFFYRNDGITSSYRKLWQFHNNIQIKSRSIFGYFLGWREINWTNSNEALAHADPQTALIIMCGDKDEITPVKYSLNISDLLPDVKSKKMIVVENCGHNLCFDDPEQVLKKFCESIW